MCKCALILFSDFYTKDIIIIMFKKKKFNSLCWGQNRLQTTDSCNDSGFQQMDAKVRGESLEILTTTE